MTEVRLASWGEIDVVYGFVIWQSLQANGWCMAGLGHGISGPFATLLFLTRMVTV